MTQDEAAIRALLDRYAAAIRDRDAAATVACLAEDVVAYEFAPPLAQRGADARSERAIQRWFDTWAGPIDFEVRGLDVRCAGDLAYAFALRRLLGKRADGSQTDMWFRATAGLERRNGAWTIAHVHNSVPFAMDGSGAALLSLQP